MLHSRYFLYPFYYPFNKNKVAIHFYVGERQGKRSQTCLVIASRMFGTILLSPSRWKDSNSGQHVEYGQRSDVFRYC
ncbi:hypothetical protein YC2023_023522 [Brassica napus]